MGVRQMQEGRQQDGGTTAVMERPAQPAPGHQTPSQRRQRLAARLFEPVDISSLVFFRIAFGAILAWEVMRFFKNGWISDFWIEPGFFFNYLGFGWLSPLPGDGMYLMFALLGLATVCFAVGLEYRFAAIGVFLGFTYIFLLDKTTYLNHFYLIILLSLLMVFVPANRAFSVDARLNPAIRSDTAPAWALWMLRTQVGLVYFFGGIAKLNGDWLRGEPIGTWLAGRTDMPIVGPLLDEEPMGHVFAYGGLTLDLLAFPLLLWRRTRPYMFVALVGFHLANTQLFNIGIFPFFMIAASTLFFDPDWPRRVLHKARDRFGAGAPAEAALPPASNGPSPNPAPAAAGNGRIPRVQAVVLTGLALWFAVQIAVPLRHHLYPGNVAWTEEGHKFSWRMKLRDKEQVSGQFIATTPSDGRSWEVNPAEYITFEQYNQMLAEPDMAIQYAHHVASEVEKTGVEKPEIRARIYISLNGRDPALLVDPTVNLAAQKRPVIGHSDWILPLREPLPD